MNAPFLTDLSSFHRFVGDKVNNGGPCMSPEEVLDEWRTLNPDAEAEAEEVAAIQEALEDLENGDTGILFEEFDRDFRKRHNLPPKS